MSVVVDVPLDPSALHRRSTGAKPGGGYEGATRRVGPLPPRGAEDPPVDSAAAIRGATPLSALVIGGVALLTLILIMLHAATPPAVAPRPRPAAVDSSRRARAGGKKVSAKEGTLLTPRHRLPSSRPTTSAAAEIDDDDNRRPPPPMEGDAGGDATAHPHRKQQPLVTAAEEVQSSAPPSTLQVSRRSVEQALNGWDVQLFVVWHGAMHKVREILQDLTLDVEERSGGGSGAVPIAARKGFAVLSLQLIDWKDWDVFFETNLWRLYNGKGGWARQGMALKTRQCGVGPFLAVVVADPEPRYALEHTAHGSDNVSHRMNDAKMRYRKWTGGGYRVHGTFSPVEALHDIGLLLHRHPSAYLEALGTQLREEPFASAADPIVGAARLSRAIVGHFVKWLDGRHTAAESVSLASAAPPNGQKAEGGPFSVFADDPVVSRRQLLGHTGWDSCAELRLAFASFTDQHALGDDSTAVAFTTHPDHALDDGEALDIAKCDAWPSEVRMVAGKKVLWAAVATIGGSVLEADANQLPVTLLVRLLSGQVRVTPWPARKRGGPRW